MIAMGKDRVGSDFFGGPECNSSSWLSKIYSWPCTLFCLIHLSPHTSASFVPTIHVRLVAVAHGSPFRWPLQISSTQSREVWDGSGMPVLTLWCFSEKSSHTCFEHVSDSSQDCTCRQLTQSNWEPRKSCKTFWRHFHDCSSPTSPSPCDTTIMQAVDVAQVKSVDRCRPQLSPGFSFVHEGRQGASFPPGVHLYLFGSCHTDASNEQGILLPSYTWTHHCWKSV